MVDLIITIAIALTMLSFAALVALNAIQGRHKAAALWATPMLLALIAMLIANH